MHPYLCDFQVGLRFIPYNKTHFLPIFVCPAGHSSCHLQQNSRLLSFLNLAGDSLTASHTEEGEHKCHQDGEQTISGEMRIAEHRDLFHDRTFDEIEHKTVVSDEKQHSATDIDNLDDIDAEQDESQMEDDGVHMYLVDGGHQQSAGHAHHYGRQRRHPVRSAGGLRKSHCGWRNRT